MKTQRTPQEKKLLSYEKDRRNGYGESDKGSRKSIRFRKRWVNQTYRSSVKQIVGQAISVESVDKQTEQDRLERVDQKVKSHQRKFWKKSPDISLKEYIRRQLAKRV